jgi:hypothetical protein
MLHLFKNIVIDFDHKIDMNQNRVIFSKISGGVKAASELEKVLFGKLIETSTSMDELIGENKKYTTLVSFLEKLNQEADLLGDFIYIYCDKAAFYELSIKWIKLVLANCDAVSAHRFIKLCLFREHAFVNSRVSKRNSPFTLDLNVTSEQFAELWQNYGQESSVSSEFLDKIRSHISIEFLAAGYFYDGRHSIEFARAISPLIRENLSSFISELRENAFIHMLNPEFQRMLKVSNGPYDIDNFYEMIYDSSEIVRMLADPEIWGDVSNSINTSGITPVNLRGLDSEKINLLREYSTICGLIWGIGVAGFSQFSGYFDFIKMFVDKDILTVDEVEQIIQYELNEHTRSVGTFYSIGSTTVNFYFINHLLNNYNNPQELKPFILE